MIVKFAPAIVSPKRLSHFRCEAIVNGIRLTMLSEYSFWENVTKRFIGWSLEGDSSNDGSLPLADDRPWQDKISKGKSICRFVQIYNEQRTRTPSELCLNFEGSSLELLDTSMK